MLHGDTSFAELGLIGNLWDSLPVLMQVDHIIP